MTDIYIWLVTIALASIILRFIPINLPMKGRMILWLTGSLISSLALLATITYTFWMGILATLVLGIVFTVLLQEKASQVFAGQDNTGVTPGVQKNTPHTEDYDYGYQNEEDEEHILEGENSEGFGGPISEEGSVQIEGLSYKNLETKEEQGIPALETIGEEGEHSRSSDVEVNWNEDEEAIQENDDLTEDSSVEDIQTQEDKFNFSEGDEEALLLDEELAQLRMEEESEGYGEDLENSEDATEEELMAERNFHLDIEENDLELELIKAEELPSDIDDTHDSIVEEDLESEEEIINEINESTDSDKDITREMNKQEEEMSVDNQEEIIYPITNHDIDPDIEDNEDSLALEEDYEEELIADEALRKQLLELMIEKIEYMEEQMTGVEYENYVKAHLSEKLPNLEYYSISKFLIKYYIKNEKTDELVLFVGELIDKFASYSLLIEELRYVLQQQVQYTK
ncbi:AzlD domain-containing protein [Halobacillus sp. SY10]|uniref:AzlD domain-containing protein n=1 Tax=Halobacillus sp. SY10 TaxID=3381356 RepID=UPI003879211F